MKKLTFPATHSLSKNAIAEFVFVLLYVLIDFVPQLGAIDIIGPQWLYVALLNIVVLFYLLITGAAALKFSLHGPARLIVLSYFVYCVLAAASIFFAINPVEGMVAYSRLIITAVAFFNFLCLTRRSLPLFPLLAQAVALIVLYYCILAVKQFLISAPELGLDDTIISMTGNTGNKNIFAASLLIKLPFVLFCVCHGHFLPRFANLLILLLCIYTIFLTNARAVYIGLGVQLLLYFCYLASRFVATKDRRLFLRESAYFLVPLIVGLIGSQFTIMRERALLETKYSYYGTVLERLGTIDLTTERGTNNRRHIFKSSVDMIRKHPFTGVGFGNWKLASIPYESRVNTDLVVNYHSHNDFLETMAETGLIAGTVYILIFLLVFVTAARGMIVKAADIPGYFIFSVIALGGYVVDASLNFPMERTTMQVYFALWLAICCAQWIEPIPGKKNIARPSAFILLVLSLPAIYLSIMVFRSMTTQNNVFPYEAGRLPASVREEVLKEMPAIPNITQTTLPVKAVQADYLIAEKRYREADSLLNISMNVNPYLGYSEYLKALVCFETNRRDSGIVYAKKAFRLRPLNAPNYELYLKICVQANDSLSLGNAFRFYTAYRSAPHAWLRYLEGLNALHADQRTLVSLSDSAIHRFPDNAELQSFRKSITK